MRADEPPRSRGAQVQHAVGQLELLEHRLGPSQDVSLRVQRAVGGGVGEELHLVELVDTQKAPGVTPGRPCLPPIARRRRGEAQGQLPSFQDLAPVHRRQRHLGGRDEPQVVAHEVIRVVGEFREVPRRRHGLGEHDRRGADLLVRGRVAVDGKGGQRTQQPRPRAPVQREHRPRQPRAAFHVEDLQGLTDLPVRHLLMLERADGPSRSRSCPGHHRRTSTLSSSPSPSGASSSGMLGR